MLSDRKANTRKVLKVNFASVIGRLVDSKALYGRAKKKDFAFLRAMAGSWLGQRMMKLEEIWIKKIKQKMMKIENKTIDQEGIAASWHWIERANKLRIFKRR